MHTFTQKMDASDRIWNLLKPVYKVLGFLEYTEKLLAQEKNALNCF